MAGAGNQPPAHPGSLTVQTAADAAPGETRDAALRRWARSVWDAWRTEHGRLREWVREWLPALAAEGRLPKGESDR